MIGLCFKTAKNDFVDLVTVDFDTTLSLVNNGDGD